jgi:dipeptidyl aminopeptidase/acylaminoacyl peptidase
VSLPPGTRLGPYEILAPLGAGGMGEVYRARDTRLGRDVAIKVLPLHLAATPEVRARFEREARTISQLNHPHICTLFDVGRAPGEAGSDGVDFLVMELLEGETLAHRLERGPQAVAEVLTLGMQIADALDRAHRAGVVHRDLKPGNVMLTKSGAKLMDFGLARATLAAAAPGTLTESPTVSRPLTAEGTIVGTFQYMAPEQLEGGEADARSDIWALGCSLYEMATGKRAFEGKSQASLISAIMKDEPRSITELQPLSPPALEHAVKRCLMKNPDDRWQNARDVMLELQWIAAASSQAGAPTPVAAPRRVPGRLAWALVGVLAIALAGAGAWQLRQRVARPPAVAFDIELPSNLQYEMTPTLSPDGRWLAFAAYDSTGSAGLWLRPLNGREMRRIPGIESNEDAGPFWSPDSRTLAFFAKGKLLRMALEGGTAEVLCDAPNPRGGSWGKDDVILFAPNSQGAIFRVPAAGGTPVAVTRVDSTHGEISHRYPRFLPDGRRFLYVSLGSEQRGHATWLASLDGRRPRHVLDATSVAVYGAPGQVVFQRHGALMAQAFDANSGHLKGQPRTLVGETIAHQMGCDNFSMSGNGLLACVTGRLGRDRLFWYDRSGRRLGPASALLPLSGGVSMSPDARQAVCVEADPGGGYSRPWLVDLGSGLATSLGFENAGSSGAIWSPDSRTLYIAARPAGRDEIHSLPLNGSGGDRLVFKPPTLLCYLADCTPDGTRLVVAIPGESGRWELWLVPTSGTGPARCLLRGPFNTQGADVSPDGRWLAYLSDESGQWEVYVTSFPVPGARHRISSDGGFGPRWVRDGRELLFGAPPTRNMAVDISAEGGFHAGTPRLLFSAPQELHGGDVTRDGNRFLLLLPGEMRPSSHLTVLVNWQNAGAR